MQEFLMSKYNKLLRFRHEEVINWNFEGLLQSVHQRSVYLDCNQAYTYFFKPQLLSTQKGRDTSAISNDCYIVITKQLYGYFFLSSTSKTRRMVKV